MKLLHVALITPSSPQRGLRDALAATAREYRETSWYPFWCAGDFPGMRTEIMDAARHFRPDVTFIQCQTEGVVTRHMLREMTGLKLEWCGDCRDVTPQHYFDRAPGIDCMTFSNMRDVEAVRAKGFNAEFLNIGFSPDPFSPSGKSIDLADIVFLGTNYAGRFPCSHQRQKMVSMLRGLYGPRFAVRGGGWGDNEGMIDEPAEAAVYRGCKIAIDNNHYQDVDRFTSDRRFRAMASGAFLLANWHPGMELDFEIGKHLVAWKSIDEIPALIDYYLAHEDERKAIAAAGCEHVHRVHSWIARMSDLQRIIKQYGKAAA